MVGGPGFDVFQYNITTQAPGRQTGSAFKGVVLAALLESGYVPADTVEGGGSFPCPGCEEDPYTIDGRGGSISSVTAASSNGAFVRLGQIVGLDKVAEMARRLGITTEFNTSAPSMPLGVFDIRPIEMASAFSAFANGGIRNPPYLVERVEDSEGNILFQHEPEGVRAMSRQSACLETEVLQGVITGGTGTRGRLANQQAAGKTGTTNENKDAWFVGYTPYLATAVWMGDPGLEPRDMNNVGGVRVQGGNYPTQIWGQFMNAYHADLPEIEFPDCDETRRGRSIRIDGSSSSRSSSDSSSSSRSRSSSRSSTADDEEDDDEDDTETSTPSPSPSPSPPPSPPPGPPPPPEEPPVTEGPPIPNPGGTVTNP
jgi:penicillin-binding protein 1A